MMEQHLLQIMEKQSVLILVLMLITQNQIVMYLAIIHGNVMLVQMVLMEPTEKTL